ncbi:sigma 54-interacting transcriptional regulator [Escherichia coli]|nr:sigma 54-interacting transcriptional regulator [Escherichia coli]MCA7243886.1 sigma 54-interacting transcriptional regulator [Escherichia coli]
MSHKTLPNLALITPYPALAAVVTEQCTGIFNCHVFHGSLEKAAGIARNLDPDFYDIIISRGGTADYIDRVTKIPVVRILTSALDLLKSLTPLKKHPHKIAFFNYQNYLSDVNLVATALEVEIEEFIFLSHADMVDKLKKCRTRNFQTVAGGLPVSDTAEHYEMQGILIENGLESVNSALREAMAIVETTRRKQQDMARLEIILSSITEGIIVTNENNEIQIFNKSAENIFGLMASQVIGKPVDTVIKNTRINQVLLTKSAEIREIMDLDNTSIITSRVPIFRGTQCIGVVCSFTDTPQIQKVERIIRGKLMKKGITARYRFEHILTQNKHMESVIHLAKIYANTHSPVMIYGESGTGKELFAQSIHNQSQCHRGPFVAINCAAIPETLLESELFGYEGGSFTGARREGKEGLIELAHQGTLFLDEIGELPLPIQSRLLRVLQEYEIMRVGGKDIIPVDVRIIGATNRSLEKMAEEGSFRGDLYYRLNVLPLMVPPLREREGDVRFLAEHFLEKSGCGHKLAQFIALFSTYNWPGNVRELNFIIERLALLSAGFPNASLFEILNLTGFNALKSCNTSQTNGRIVADLSKGQLKAVIKDLERQIIAFYMDLFEQDQEKVAAHLGISKMSLWRKYNQMDR